jgi:hypothetical protein
VEVVDDAAAAALVDAARRDGRAAPVVGLLGGDLRRTLGGGAAVDHLGDEVGEYTVDVGVVTLDGVERAFVAHLVARRSWWRGELVAAMNAEPLRRWDLAPRGHPNDGRLDVVHVVDLGLHDRWKAWRRLPTGTHVPHPAIGVRPAASADLTLRRPLRVFLDGRPAGRRTTSRSGSSRTR